MVTDGATQSGLPSFDWTPRRTGALVPAAAPCAHLPWRVQMNLEHCRFVSEAYLGNLSLDEDQMPHA